MLYLSTIRPRLQSAATALTLITVVAACGDHKSPGTEPTSPGDTRATNAIAISAGDQQLGEVAATLPIPLRVKVTSGTSPRGGVHVTWHTARGAVVPASSITDASGFATASWTLGPNAGEQAAYADVETPTPLTARFAATALPGEAAVIGIHTGDKQRIPVNAARGFAPLAVFVLDRFGNYLFTSPQINWSVTDGPLSVETAGTATLPPRFLASVTRVGTRGVGHVRASLANTTSAVDFTIEVSEPEFEVAMIRNCDNPKNDCFPVFQSQQFGLSLPAVDTIPVGATVQWRHALGVEFSIDEEIRHQIVSTGELFFPSSPQLTNGATYRLTFTVPGTYHYVDRYNASATGTLVVR